MRKFYIENSIGERIDLQSKTLFLWAPSGLGFGETKDYTEVEYGFFAETVNEYTQPEFNGTMVFKKGTQEPYISYKEFVDWISTSQDLQLVYSPYTGRELYLDVNMEFLELTEKNQFGMLECPVIFKGLSPYHKKNPLTLLFQSSVTANPMRFPFKFPFRFSDGETGDSQVFTPEGHFPAAIELTINGPVSHPYFKCENENTGEVYGMLDLSAVSLGNGEKIYYSSRPNMDGVWKISGGTQTDLIDMLDINNTNFFQIPVGVKCKATLTADVQPVVAKIEHIGGETWQEGTPTPDAPGRIWGAGETYNLWDFEAMAAGVNAAQAGLATKETLDGVECWKIGTNPNAEARAVMYGSFEPNKQYRIKYKFKYDREVARTDRGVEIGLCYTDDTFIDLQPAGPAGSYVDVDFMTAEGKTVKGIIITYGVPTYTYIPVGSTQITEGAEDWPVVPYSPSVNIISRGRNMWDFESGVIIARSVVSPSYVTAVTFQGMDCWRIAGGVSGQQAREMSYDYGFEPNTQYRAVFEIYYDHETNRGNYPLWMYDDGTVEIIGGTYKAQQKWMVVDALSNINKNLVGVSFGAAYGSVITYIKKESTQITKGIEDWPVVPYQEERLSIPVDAPLYAIADSSGNIVARDSIDIENGKVVRECGIITLGGTEAWTLLNFNDTSIGLGLIVSDIYQTTDINMFRCSHGICGVHIGDNIAGGLYTNYIFEKNMGFAIPKSSCGVVSGDTNAQMLAKGKAWLAVQKEAGTPVTLLYQLETPVETPIPAGTRAAMEKGLATFTGYNHITCMDIAGPDLAVDARGNVYSGKDISFSVEPITHILNVHEYFKG